MVAFVLVGLLLVADPAPESHPLEPEIRLLREEISALGQGWLLVQRLQLAEDRLAPLRRQLLETRRKLPSMEHSIQQRTRLLEDLRRDLPDMTGVDASQARSRIKSWSEQIESTLEQIAVSRRLLGELEAELATEQIELDKLYRRLDALLE